MAETLLLLSANDELRGKMGANGGYCESFLSGAELNDLPTGMGSRVLAHDENTGLYHCFVFDARNFDTKVIHPGDSAQEMRRFLESGYSLGHDGAGVLPTVLITPLAPSAAGAVAA